MNLYLKAFVIAMQFMTRLPMPNLFSADDEDHARLMGYSMLFYPLVGLILGAILYAAGYFLGTMTDGANTEFLIAALLLVIWVGLTGALHLDGLADSADAWLGGFGDKQRTLEIMKDPTSGPAGVTAIVLLLMVKLSAIYTVLFSMPEAIIIAPLIGRLVVLVLFMTTNYVRKDGIGAQGVANLPTRIAWLVIVASVMAILIYAPGMVFALIVVAITFWAMRWVMIKRIDGTTGDTAGAVIEVSEVVFLIALVLTV